MATIHLNYNSLERLLKFYDERIRNRHINVNEYRSSSAQFLLFVKKINISNILHLIPTDVCKIINEYSKQIISISCKIYQRTLFFSYKTSAFDFGISTTSSCDQYSLVFGLNQSENIQCLEVLSGYEKTDEASYTLDYTNAYCILNAFMKHMYNRSSYFECKNLPTTYIHNDLLKNTIILNDKKYLTGVKIYNLRDFRYMIVFVKCILRGIHKYYAPKTAITSKQEVTEFRRQYIDD